MAEPSWTEEMIAEARRLYEAGISASECAKAISLKFNVTKSRNAIIGIWFRQGFGPRARVAHQSPVPIKRSYPKQRKPALRPEGYRALPKPKPASATKGDPANPRYIKFGELDGKTCRWPYGDGPFTFCGCDSIDGFPYCRWHALEAIDPSRRPAIERRSALEAVAA